MTDKEREQKYKDVFNSMIPEKQYTAAELGVAPASMTAMVNRGMVTKIAGKPMKYIKVIKGVSVKNKLILDIIKQYPNGSYISFGKNGYVKDVICMICDNKICDINDYMKPLEFDNFDYFFIKGKKFDLKMI